MKIKLPLIATLIFYSFAAASSEDAPCHTTEQERLLALINLVSELKEKFSQADESHFYLEEFDPKYENRYPEALQSDLVWITPDSPMDGKASIFSSCNVILNGQYLHTSICRVQLENGATACEARRTYAIPSQ